MKHLYALQGAGGTGKSCTLRMLYTILLTKYEESTPHDFVEYKEFNDFRVIIDNIKGLKIGIVTEGDPDSELSTDLTFCQSVGCDIIFCVCHQNDTVKNSTTVAAVKNLENSYTIHFIRKSAENNTALFYRTNFQQAEQLRKMADL